MHYRLIEQIPTNQGRSVSVAQTASGDLIIVKHAHTAEWAAELAKQARHFLVMGGLLGVNSIYPRVLEYSDDTLVIPFYDHGSLDQLSCGKDRAVVKALTQAALSHVFRIARIQPPASPPPPEAAHNYLAEAATARLTRLDRAISAPAGRDWSRAAAAGYPSRLEQIEEGVTWIRDEGLLARISVLGPSRLAPAAHGDFGLNNVMLAERPAMGAKLVFIDTRGMWHDGYPWWDPIMDLATLVAFHCHIEPALARAGELPANMASGAGRLSAADVLELVSGAPEFVAWAETDDNWRQRLEVEIAIRLLGNVGVQLISAPQNPGLRAAVVLDLYARQARRVTRLLDGRV